MSARPTATRKQVLVISSSPRRKGNSERLAERFAQGAAETGHEVETIRLGDHEIGFCTGCGVCFEGERPCPQKDDATEILEKMVRSDVLVLASPVYFYAMSAQLKVLIDRVCARYREIHHKDVYVLLTAADEKNELVEKAMEGFRGFIACLDQSREAGVVYGTGVSKKGDIEGTPALEEAYRLGLGA